MIRRYVAGRLFILQLIWRKEKIKLLHAHDNDNGKLIRFRYRPRSTRDNVGEKNNINLPLLLRRLAHSSCSTHVHRRTFICERRRSTAHVCREDAERPMRREATV